MSTPSRTTARNATRAIEVLRRHGVAKTSRRAVSAFARRFGEAVPDVLLDFDEIADSSALPALPDIPAPSPDRPLRIGWLCTPPGPGSGGHTTMFRMVEALEAAGHECRVILHDFYDGDTARHERTIRSGWPRVAASVTTIANGFEGLDACFATAWHTAHLLLSRCEEPLQRMYLIQDYEPYFYGHGSPHALAEDTYRFGLHCFTVGPAIAQILRKRHGVTADVIDFGCDTDVYHLTNTDERNGVVMYARPDVPRRGYVHNVAALAAFHKLHPEQTIHVFGPPIGSLPFPHVHHGLLSPAQLNDLYNGVITGLATSFTNMTLIAEEMLAAGAIPVINDTEIGRAGLTNDSIVWARPTPAAMAEALSRVVESPHQVARSHEAASSVVTRTWTSAQDKFVQSVQRIVYQHRSIV